MVGPPGDIERYRAVFERVAGAVERSLGDDPPPGDEFGAHGEADGPDFLAAKGIGFQFFPVLGAVGAQDGSFGSRRGTEELRLGDGSLVKQLLRQQGVLLHREAVLGG